MDLKRRQTTYLDKLVVRSTRFRKTKSEFKKLGHKMKLIQHIRILWGDDKSSNERIKHNNDMFRRMDNNSSWKEVKRSQRHKSWNSNMHSMGDRKYRHQSPMHNKRNLSVNNMKRPRKISLSDAIHHRMYSEAALNESFSSNTNT